MMKRIKRIFSKEEDEKLVQLISEYGEDWKLIAKNLGNRNVRQCRERWQKYLNPGINKDKWTEEDDELLMNEYKKLGPKWKRIAVKFLNRTDINVKNRYRKLERKKKKENRMKLKKAILLSQKEDEQEEYGIEKIINSEFYVFDEDNNYWKNIFEIK